MRRLDIGIASYRNPEALQKTLDNIEQYSTTDWKCYIIHNPAEGDEKTRNIIAHFVSKNPKFIPIYMEENKGYAGAVNKLFSLAETEYIAYCDNDIEIQTKGWDERLCSYLDRFHEIGMIFPNGGAYQINRGNYKEILWGVGFCWIINRLAMSDTGTFDESLGHQEEADYCQRVRMQGWKCAAATEVHVKHLATASSDPSAVERINRGVVNWVNKWNKYFNGKNFHYSSPNVTRIDDWPPNALYLEEYWKLKFPDMNTNPETIKVDGREYDLIKVPRYSGFYRGRII